MAEVELAEGLVVKAYNQWFDVFSGGVRVLCRSRGRLRVAGILVGDAVKINPQADGTGVIEEVLPRKTRLHRPPIANVEQVLVVCAVVDPPPNLGLLDRLLVLSRHEGLEPLLVLNKMDLVAGGEDRLPLPVDVYRNAGYDVFLTSARTGEGVRMVGERLAGRLTVLAGPSGAGKSSLLNAIHPDLALKTGDVSVKSGRGRHTTRHVELLRIGASGWVADTPGFSRLDLEDVNAAQLSHYFPEMDRLRERCGFRACLHRAEPGCAVRDAVSAGALDAGRHQRYLEILAEAEDRRQRQKGRRRQR